MSNEHIIRAWKDEGYREGLSEDERGRLPENPAGGVELSDAMLSTVAGGTRYTRIIRATGKVLVFSINYCVSIFGSCRAYTRGCC